MGANLFLKMFLGFWLATVTIAGSWFMVNQYFEAQPEEAARTERGDRGVPHRFMLRKLYDLQNAERDNLEEVLAQASKSSRVTVFLLDAGGEDLLDREVPAAAKAAARQLDRRRRGVVREEGRRYVALEVFRPDTGQLRAVFRFEPPAPTVLGVLGANPWLRLAMAIVISGLVCYLLSRLLTSRLAQLREASHRLAQGDLSTRAPVRERGGDETDALARDFNVMAEQLQERILAQKQLLSDVSHELRSPLARLHVALALAQNDPANSAAQLSRIEQETHRLEDLIAQLLRSQAAPTSLDEHIDLVSLLQVVAEDARFEATGAEKTVVLSSTLEEAIVASSGDLLRKSFDNVLRNALLYSPKGSTITIHIAVEDSHYVVQVEDEGPGVPEADLERIFTAFYRVDSSRTRESGGYGLGLAIAYRAVALHGGNVQATNTARGLCVTITLPRPDLNATAAGLDEPPR